MAVPLVQMQSSGGTTILEPSVGELCYRHQLPQGPGGTRGCSPEVEALWESHRDALADSFVVTKPAWRTCRHQVSAAQGVRCQDSRALRRGCR